MNSPEVGPIGVRAKQVGFLNHHPLDEQQCYQFHTDKFRPFSLCYSPLPSDSRVHDVRRQSRMDDLMGVKWALERAPRPLDWLPGATKIAPGETGLWVVFGALLASFRYSRRHSKRVISSSHHRRIGISTMVLQRFINSVNHYCLKMSGMELRHSMIEYYYEGSDGSGLRRPGIPYNGRAADRGPSPSPRPLSSLHDILDLY